MGMYAIKDTTLTALGDAVRKHTIGVSEEELIQKIEGIMFDKQNSSLIVVAQNKAPKYRYILDNGYVSTEVVGNTFYIKRDDSLGEKLYDEGKLTNSIFPISFETDADTIYIFFNTSYSSVYTTFDLTIIPLDENGNEYKYTPLEMVEVINDLMVVPNEALYMTGSCASRFANNKWNWFVKYGDKIITNDITDISNMFNSSNQLTNIPFDINMKTSQYASAERVFYNCQELRNIPMISNLKISALSVPQYMFYGCNNIRYFPEGFADDWDFSNMKSSSVYGMTYLFNGCFSLRKIPLSLIGNLCSRGTNSSSCSYYGLFTDCTSLDEINGVEVSQATLSSNCFSYTFSGVSRLKDMTFAINEDGASKTANWKNQTIDLSGAGYLSVDAIKKFILNYNSGITADKEVKDDATYQALKDDPDWFSVNINYSRYNHDSAVNTINSLPDCSATGTNTIKFKGTAGSLTDGGAINTLTEEEIAVAVSKGWQVAFV